MLKTLLKVLTSGLFSSSIHDSDTISRMFSTSILKTFDSTFSYKFFVNTGISTKNPTQGLGFFSLFPTKDESPCFVL